MGAEAGTQQCRGIGFIGLGRMGLPMAERLIGAGVSVHVFDPRAEAVAALVARGAIRERSARAVADRAQIVFACLASPAVCAEAAFGEHGVAGGGAISTYVEMSTMGPAAASEMAAALAERGIAFVDAPVSGGPEVARAGRLSIILAGAERAISEVLPWCTRIGANCVVVGTNPGQAQMLKLINNLVMATNMVVAAEGLAFGVKAGLDVGSMIDVLRASSGYSTSLAMLADSGVSGRFDFGAGMNIVAKDVALAIAEADRHGAPIPTMAATDALWRTALALLGAETDFTGILQIIEGAAGVTVRR